MPFSLERPLPVTELSDINKPTLEAILVLTKTWLKAIHGSGGLERSAISILRPLIAEGADRSVICAFMRTLRAFTAHLAAAAAGDDDPPFQKPDISCSNPRALHTAYEILYPVMEASWLAAKEMHERLDTHIAMVNNAEQVDDDDDDNDDDDDDHTNIPAFAS